MKQEKKASHLDRASLFFGVVSMILVGLGVVLNVSSTDAAGITDPNKYGLGGGTVNIIPGNGVILIGIFFALFPLKDLILELKDRITEKKS